MEQITKYNEKLKIMILTGKCLEDFNKWFRTERATPNLRYWMLITMEEVILNALIIEWLDSVGVYISVPPFFDKQAKYNRGFESLVYKDNSNTITESFNDNDVFYSRQEAINAAIKKANDIYNGI